MGRARDAGLRHVISVISIATSNGWASAPLEGGALRAHPIATGKPVLEEHRAFSRTCASCERYAHWALARFLEAPTRRAERGDTF